MRFPAGRTPGALCSGSSSSSSACTSSAESRVLASSDTNDTTGAGITRNGSENELCDEAEEVELDEVTADTGTFAVFAAKVGTAEREVKSAAEVNRECSRVVIFANLTRGSSSSSTEMDEMVRVFFLDSSNAFNAASVYGV